MKDLILEASDSTPQVLFLWDKEELLIEGRSHPGDAISFYKKIFDWLEKYCEKKDKSTVMNFELEYFNTASAKMLVEVILKLKDGHSDGSELTVNWGYFELDEEMKEVAGNIEEITEVKINLRMLEE